jgi:uncharacterized Zn-binding protein involved in type VI secretion
MQPAARATDTHVCPNGVPGVLLPPVGAPSIVKIGGLLAAYVTTPATPCFAGPNTVVKGSSKVKINGMPAARITDKTAHGSTITTGFPKVMIAD